MKNFKTGIGAVVFPVAAEGVHLRWAPVDDYPAFLRDMQMPTTSLYASFMPQDLPFERKDQNHYPQRCCDSKMREQNIVTPYNPCIIDLITYQESLATKGASA